MRNALTLKGVLEGDAMPQLLIPELVQFFKRDNTQWIKWLNSINLMKSDKLLKILEPEILLSQLLF